MLVQGVPTVGDVIRPGVAAERVQACCDQRDRNHKDDAISIMGRIAARSVGPRPSSQFSVRLRVLAGEDRGGAC
jgi:hypothetical protein